jgi:hypothetical protein
MRQSKHCQAASVCNHTLSEIAHLWKWLDLMLHDSVACPPILASRCRNSRFGEVTKREQKEALLWSSKLDNFLNCVCSQTLKTNMALGTSDWPCAIPSGRMFWKIFVHSVKNLLNTIHLLWMRSLSWHSSEKPALTKPNHPRQGFSHCVDTEEPWCVRFT